MHDWSDNELDSMSREAADNYGPDRRVPDWNSLQKQLDKELPEHKEDNRRRFFFLIFLCLILTGVTGYLLISQNSGTTNRSNPITSNASQQSASEKNGADKPGIDNSNPDRNNNAGSAAIDKQKENDLTNNNDANKQLPTASDKLSEPSTTNSRKTSSALSLSTNPQNNSLNPSTGSKKSSNPKNKNKKNKADEALAITVEGSSVNKNNPSKGKTNPQKNESATAAAIGLTEAGIATNPEATDATKPGADKAAADPTLTAKDTVATNASAKKTTTVKSPTKSSAFEVSLLAGVDISNVKFKYNDDAGFNAGLLLGYRFNKKWSVGTGLIYTKKNYTAAGSDYNPSKTYMQSTKLEKVDGSCYMWELPVYATYHFKSNKKSGWFVNMGLSSYFMTKENYTFHYTAMTPPAPPRYWQNSDPSNYWFSILGISGGWEKNIGRGLSLGVAPYAKIPIQGVGYGNMSLSSYGVNLLLTYRKATGRK